MEDRQDIVIDDSNFNEHFFPVSKFSPRKDQIMARFLAKADLMYSDQKKYLVDMLLTDPMGAEMGVQLMKKWFSAKEMDAIEVCKLITQDLIGGMTREEVLAKPYRFTIEMFFWTKEEYVPKDSPHWKAIKVTMVNQNGKPEE